MTDTITEPGDNQIKDWVESLLELEGQINALQGSKKDLYGSIRDDHGRVTADALKNVTRILRMDGDKRAKVTERDAETDRLLAIVEGSRAHGAGAPHVREKSLTNSDPKPIVKHIAPPKPAAEVLPPEKPNGALSAIKSLPVMR